MAEGEGEDQGGSDLTDSSRPASVSRGGDNGDKDCWKLALNPHLPATAALPSMLKGLSYSRSGDFLSLLNCCYGNCPDHSYSRLAKKKSGATVSGGLHPSTWPVISVCVSRQRNWQQLCPAIVGKSGRTDRHLTMEVEAPLKLTAPSPRIVTNRAQQSTTAAAAASSPHKREEGKGVRNFHPPPRVRGSKDQDKQSASKGARATPPK